MKYILQNIIIDNFIYYEVVIYYCDFMNYKILQKSGKDMLKEIMELKKHESHFPVDMEYAKRYLDSWRTMEISGELPRMSVHSDDVSTPNGKMFEFIRGVGSNDEYFMTAGKWSSPSKNKKYVVGREPGTHYGGKLYYVSIKPDGGADKRMTDITVGNSISRIHTYLKNVDDELLSITNLGITPLKVKIENHELLI